MQLAKSLIALYRLSFADAVVSLLQTSNYRLDKFAASFWNTSDFSALAVQPDASTLVNRNNFLRLFITVGSLAQLVFGAILLGLGASGEITGGIYFGAALIISYPLVWAHLVLIPALGFRMVGWPKALGKRIVLAVLSRQVRQLRARHDFKVIAVAGSAGKTSTKFAIAQTLETKLKVRWQQGNYNDVVSVPLIIFGQQMPSLANPLAWLKIFRTNASEIKNWNYDAVVLELGSDGPGQIEQFGKYLKVDIGIITAVAPEHMEFFGSLDAVASEELALAKFTDKLLVNSDLVAPEYLGELSDYQSYGFKGGATCRLTGVRFKDQKYSFSLVHNNKQLAKATTNYLSRNQLYGAAAAAVVAGELGLKKAEINKAITGLTPASGRLKPLAGIKNSTILDDSYNSAPEAALAALETLYKIKAPQKIAVLGSMNELGNYSAEAHKLVGEFCDPKQLDMVITIGASASEFLAPVASATGCKVKSFADPISAGNYAKKRLKSKSLILVKGSQNGVFAEEAVKILLKNPSDASELVRQSPGWLAVKQNQFKL